MDCEASGVGGDPYQVRAGQNAGNSWIVRSKSLQWEDPKVPDTGPRRDARMYEEPPSWDSHRSMHAHLQEGRRLGRAHCTPTGPGLEETPRR